MESRNSTEAQYSVLYYDRPQVPEKHDQVKHNIVIISFSECESSKLMLCSQRRGITLLFSRGKALRYSNADVGLHCGKHSRGEVRPTRSAGSNLGNFYQILFEK